MECTTHEQIINTVAEIELVYRTNVKPSQRPTVKCSKDAYKLFLESWDRDRIEMAEQFKVMLLNRGKKVLGIVEISTGGITGTVADPRLVLAAALKALACSIILCHNHPSGQLEPSSNDTKLTTKIKEAGKFMDIDVIDSLIISEESYCSLADEGLL